jgi:uncharacterized membrane protein
VALLKRATNVSEYEEAGTFYGGVRIACIVYVVVLGCVIVFV